MGNDGSTACASPACNAFNSSDPAADTVKIDGSALAMLEKENAAPNILRCKAAEDQKENRDTEAMRRAEEERLAQQEWQRYDLEQRRVQEQQRQRAEAERAEKAKEVEQEELMERRRQQVAATQREEAAGQEQDAREEEVRRQEAERIAQEQLAKQASDQKAVEEFLAANHFTDVNFKRRKMLKSCYPLHEAVSQKNIVMAELLVAAKADLQLKSSAGETPLQLAQRTNSLYSHAPLLKVLRPAPAPAKSKK